MNGTGIMQEMHIMLILDDKLLVELYTKTLTKKVYNMIWWLLTIILLLGFYSSTWLNTTSQLVREIFEERADDDESVHQHTTLRVN